MKLKDKVAIITGEGTGIGKAISLAFVNEGMTCVVFLASDDSSAITGHNLIASCGFHLIHPNIIH